MGLDEKRKFFRVDSINLLNYVFHTEDGEEAHQGMGRTLNISESGILLETHAPLEKGLLLSLMIGLEDDVVVIIKGKVVFMLPKGEKSFESGINFLELDESSLNTLKVYITAFRAYEKNT